MAIQFPLKIQFRDVERSDKIYNAIWDRVERLASFYNRIVSCEVVVSTPHQHRVDGLIYHIQIRLYVPGEDIFIGTEPELNGAHKDPFVAVRDAFDAAQRKLEDLIRRERGYVKVKEPPQSRAKVVRVFPQDECGFLLTPEGREIYFHKNALLNENFEKLAVGDEVRFSEELGEKGPQATSLSLMGH